MENFLGEVPENPEIVEFLKSETFNRKFRKFGEKVCTIFAHQWKFPEIHTRMFGRMV